MEIENITIYGALDPTEKWGTQVPQSSLTDNERELLLSLVEIVDQLIWNPDHVGETITKKQRDTMWNLVREILKESK